MEAIILAGGLGTRLRDSIGELPKCLAPINDRPFLFYLHRSLMRAGVDRIIHSLGYKHEKVLNYLEEVQSSELNIDYVIEQRPLGTGGGIKLALQKATDENLLVVNGDTFFDMDYKHFMEQHNNRQALTSIALKPMKEFQRYGSVEIHEHRVIAFHEKKYQEQGLINAGVYALNRQYFLSQELPEAFSMETDYLLPQTSKRLVHAVVFDDYFIDIGIPQDYKKAQQDFR